MFKEPYDIVYLDNHIDVRGSLFEMLRFKDNKIPGKGYIYCFTINPGQTRGGHYHKKKQEWFTCVNGQVSVIIRDKNAAEKKIIISATKPVIVYCGRNIFHELRNETEKAAVVVSYGSHQHDPDAPDTFKK